MKVSFSNDWAFMGLVDYRTYSVSLPCESFDYCAFVESVAAQMELGRVVAWGTPEIEFTVEILREAPLATGVDRSFTQSIVSSGDLCLASFDSFVEACLIPESSLPLEADTVIPLEAGRYTVTVQQLFAWDETTQFPDDPEEEVKYRIYILPAESGQLVPASNTVPWTTCKRHVES